MKKMSITGERKVQVLAEDTRVSFWKSRDTKSGDKSSDNAHVRMNVDGCTTWMNLLEKKKKKKKADN